MKMENLWNLDGAECTRAIAILILPVGGAYLILRSEPPGVVAAWSLGEEPEAGAEARVAVGVAVGLPFDGEPVPFEGETESPDRAGGGEVCAEARCAFSCASRSIASTSTAATSASSAESSSAHRSTTSNVCGCGAGAAGAAAGAARGPHAVMTHWRRSREAPLVSRSVQRRYVWMWMPTRTREVGSKPPTIERKKRSVVLSWAKRPSPRMRRA